MTVLNPTGGAASSFSSAARTNARLSALGLKGQAYDLAPVAATGATITTQQVEGTLTGFLAGDVITNLVFSIGQVATGTTPTGIFVGIYDLTGVLLGSSANLAASSIWTAAIGPVTAPLSAPVTIATTGGYYAAFLSNGVFGTIVLKLHAGNQSIGWNVKFGTNSFPTVKQTAQATLPAPATFVAGVTNLWAGWN